MPVILKKFVGHFLVVLALWAMAPLSHAGNVTIQTQMGAQVWGRRLEVIVKIANLGNDSALDVSATLDALGKNRSGQFAQPENVAALAKKGGVEGLLDYGNVRLRGSGDSLGPGDAVAIKYVMELPRGTEGSYPVILRIAYKDGNSLAFQSLAGLVFKTPGASPPKLKATVSQTWENGVALMAVHLSNASGKALQVKANLALPAAMLTCRNPARTLEIPPGGQADLDFTVESLTDRHGEHTAYCVLEYQDGQIHHAVLAGTTLVINPKPHWFSRSRPLWLGVDAVLACLFAGAWISAGRSQNAGA